MEEGRDTQKYDIIFVHRSLDEIAVFDENVHSRRRHFRVSAKTYHKKVCLKSKERKVLFLNKDQL